MSLIPSESYSFPDHFTSTVTPLRKPKQKPEEVKAVKKPVIVALPDPEPEPELEVFAEPVAEPEVFAEPWEPELPPPPIIAAEPIPEPEMVSEMWEPEEPQVKPLPLRPRKPNPVLRRVQALLPRVLTKTKRPVVESEINSESWEPEMPEVKAPPPPPPARPAPPPAPKPNPALRRAQAPPPKVQEAPVRKIALPPTLKPKVRWNNRAAPLDPNRNGTNGNGNGAQQPAPAQAQAQNVIPMRAAKPAPPPQVITSPRPVQPRMMAVPRPAQPAPVLQKPVQSPQPPPPRRPAVPATQARPIQPKPKPAPPKPAPPVAARSQTEFFEAFEDNAYELASLRRKHMKFRRFVTCEAGALLVLVPLVILGLTLNVSAPAIRWIMNILTIAAAIAAVVIPIVFYAATPTLPEIER